MKISEAVDLTLREVVSVEPDHTIADVVYLLEEHSIGAVVVTRDGRAIDGILSERDIVRYLRIEQEGLLRLPAEDLMTSRVKTCKADDGIDAVMDAMTGGHFRHMPVVDDDGAVISMISLADLAAARLADLRAENIELREYSRI